MRLMIVLLSVFVLLSCAPRRMGQMQPDLAAEADAWSARLAGKSGLEGAEREAFASAMRDIGEYCAARYGRAGFRRLVASATEPSKLADAMQQVSGSNMIDLSEDYTAWLDRSSRPSNRQWQTTNTDHFIITYREGSAAARDIRAIEIEAERALDQSCEQLGFSRERLQSTLDSVVMERDSASGLFCVHGGSLEHTGGKIVLTLFDTPREYYDRRFGHPRYSHGVTTYALGWWEDFRPWFALRVALVYRSPFELIVITHEVIHAVHILASTDVVAWGAIVESEADEPGTRGLTLEERDRVYGNRSTGWMEGLATCGMLRFGLLARGGVELGLGSMMADVVRGGDWKGLGHATGPGFTLTSWDKARAVLGNIRPAKRKIRAMYIGMGCFVDYLLQTYGTEKLQLVSDKYTDSTGRYIESVYGTTLEDMERDWLASIGAKRN